MAFPAQPCRGIASVMLAAVSSQTAAQVPVQLPEPPPPPPMVRVAGADELPTPPARLPVYFSPDPPPLGAAIDRVTPLLLPTWDAPATLAGYVGEPFYAVLGTQLAEQNLSGRQQRRLEEFVNYRAAVRANIRARLGGSAAPERNGGATSEVLETKAEELRQLLYSHELDWNRHRLFGVGPAAADVPAGVRMKRELLVLIAAAYYVDGLSPAQRRLLLEFTIDLPAARSAAEHAAPPATPGTTVFFFPETARIEIPAGLPAAVYDELARFLQRKHEIKREIATEVLRTDRVSEGKRDRALAELARRHASIIAELESQAESLRQQFAAPSRTSVPARMPESVVRLAHAYVDRRQAMQDQLLKRLRAVRRELLTYAPGSEVLHWNSTMPTGTYVMAPGWVDDSIRLAAPAAVDETPQQKRRPLLAAERLKQTMDQFATDTRKERTRLEADRQALFRQVARALGHTVEMADELPAELAALVATELQTIAQQRRAPGFADYETAVLRPGLSPADRRTLFIAALENLALPLPPAVRRPVGRFE